MLQGLSANIKLPESHQDLSHALLAVSERFFTNGKSVVFSVPVRSELRYVSPGNSDVKQYYGDVQEVTVTQNSLCNAYNSSFKIEMFSAAYKSYIPPRGHKYIFSEIRTEGVNTVLEYLHVLGHWSVFVSPAINSSILLREEECQNFIFTVNYKNNDLTKLDKEISQQIQFQTENKLRNPSGHFIVVVMGDPGKKKVARKIFKCFFHRKYFDTVVILRDPESRDINIFYPNTFCSTFPEPALFGIWIQDKERGMLFQNPDFNKEHIEQNLTDCCFRVQYTFTDPFVILDPMDPFSTKKEGLDVTLLQIFTNVFGVSNKNCGSRSVNITIANNMVKLYFTHLDHFDLTTSYFTRRYKFFVPIAQMYPRWASLTRVFTPLAWNYTMLFDDVDTLLAYSSVHEIENRSYISLSSIDVVTIAFLSEHAAVMTNEDFFMYYSKKLCGSTEPPVYHKFSGEAIQMHVQMVVYGGRYLFSKFNQVLGRLVQAGIPLKIMSDITDPLGHLGISRAAVDLSEEYVPMSLSIMQSPFIFLFLGLFLSLIAFLCETLYH
ncbi:hypothetical protein ANN_00091 [Periplaneta americana]|uniref:Uncharacterized protein n=1 Tax=Periplaneta americana TaxID=6978 RepID=A0ABQ8TRF2_PERAM|nr:hypothetical protein ANN_00091 [Periplaneta americana]